MKTRLSDFARWVNDDDAFDDVYQCTEAKKREREALKHRRAALNHTHAVPTVKTLTQQPEQVKVTMSQTRELCDDHLGTLAKANPKLVENLFRFRLKVTMMDPPRDWLNANCTGFFLIDNHFNADDEDYPLSVAERQPEFVIGFETEDDFVLFKMTFDGKDK